MNDEREWRPALAAMAKAAFQTTYQLNARRAAVVINEQFDDAPRLIVRERVGCDQSDNLANLAATSEIDDDIGRNQRTHG